MEITANGSKLVNLYVPGTVVGISGIRLENGQTHRMFVINRTSVEWVETDSLDVTAGLEQTLTLLAIDDEGDDLGNNPISVKTHMYDIEVM